MKNWRKELLDSIYPKGELAFYRDICCEINSIDLIAIQKQYDKKMVDYLKKYIKKSNNHDKEEA